MKVIFQLAVLLILAVGVSSPIQSMQPCPEGQHLDHDGACVDND